jgi:nitrous oxide reductase
MPGQDHPNHIVQPANSPGTHERQPPLSRRSMLGRTAGFGAVGLAVAAGGGTTAGVVLSRSQSDTPAQSQGNSAAAAAAGTPGSGAIVIYMANPSSGEMQIFAGTGQTRHTNHAMTATVMSMAPR